MLNQSMHRKVSLTIWLVVTAIVCFSQTRQQWVDSVFRTMSADEKIGQLLMVRVAAGDEASAGRLFSNIKSYGVGGAIITQGGPLRVSGLVNKAQAASHVPMLFGIEAVRGVGFTLDSVQPLPPPLVLNALRNDSLIAASAQEVARQMKILQLHINFMPIANTDASSDPYPDKLLHFGTDRLRVARAAKFFVEAHDAQGIMSVAQHDVRSKHGTTATELLYRGIPDSALFHSYREMISRGLKGIVTSGLPYFYLERHRNLPPSASQIFVSEHIKRSLGFNGLTFTDIPSLQKVVSKPRGGETELLAFQVGNDMLIDPVNIPATVKKIRKTLKKNLPLQQHLDSTVRKILSAKFNAGLAHMKPVDTDNLVRKLNSREASLLRQRLNRESVTLVTNEGGEVPIRALAKRRFAVVSVGMDTENTFSHTLSKFAPFDKYSIRLPEDTLKLLGDLPHYDVVVLASFPLAQNLLPTVGPALQRLTHHHLILAHFGDPSLLDSFHGFSAVIAGYTDDAIAQRSAAELIFGSIPARGRLPLTVSDKWREGAGASISTINRFSYGMPEEAGMDSRMLEQIDAVAREAIDSMATPGCHVLVARHGKVVYDRSFGWYTYDNKVPVSDETIYDLASVTKVTATLQAVMYLEEQKQIDVNKKVSVYLPELVSTNKKDITIKDMLTHQSGLLPFIPMWPQTIKDNTFDPYYYSATRSESYPLHVAGDLFVAPYIRDSAWHWAVQSRLLDRAPRTPFAYRYSDMGSMVLHRMANKLLPEPMEKFLQQYFYEPLGAQTMGYLPLERFPISQIAPTEIDTTYRKTLIAGTVHDERAAMLGGVAGHAGLFGNATDLAKVCQMLLNGGNYGGIQFFKPETVHQFTAKQYENSRRGLGWDKPTGDWNGPTAVLASPLTFGHTGFTGTCIWIDPEFDLVFVFLSNRVWPDRNNKLLNANIRPRIQEIIYRSIFDYCRFEE
jgi:beta-N-acetylhexosaminidase